MINKVTMKQEIAEAYLRVFDTKDGDKILEFMEANYKQGFPNYSNNNLHYAISGKLQLIDEIRANVVQAKNLMEVINGKSRTKKVRTR